MKLGYLKDTGNAARGEQQRLVLENAGVDQVYADHLDTPKAVRRKLRQMKQEMAPGDCVVVESLPCLGRNLKDLLEQLEELREKEVRFISLQEGIDTALDSGAALLPILNSLLHFDRNMSNFWSPAEKRQNEENVTSEGIEHCTKKDEL